MFVFYYRAERILTTKLTSELSEKKTHCNFVIFCILFIFPL